MTFEEANEAKVTKTEAELEIKKHGHDFQDFLNDKGDLPEYQGSTVLGWLGY